MIALFVTGTDTGVGKTYLSTALLRAARAIGLRTAALKPAESGWDAGTGSDGEALREAAGLTHLAIETVVPYRYRTPVAPAVAARLEGNPVTLARVRSALAALLAHEPDLLLVEGAGGLLVPFADDLLAADLAADLGFPLLIVARAGLGTINHTLLTVAEAHRRGLAVAGVVLNRVRADTDPSEASNADEIMRLAGVRLLGTFAHGATDGASVLEQLLG